MPTKVTSGTIEIPFQPAFQLPMLTGVKTATTRTKRYGWPGDTFQAFDSPFLLGEVKRLPLADVRAHYYKREGFNSPADFERCWAVLHPRKGYLPKQYVYLHLFALQLNLR